MGRYCYRLGTRERKMLQRIVRLELGDLRRKVLNYVEIQEKQQLSRNKG
jgi:hypothetical protein